jgi:FkbM family methyltransferase
MKFKLPHVVAGWFGYYLIRRNRRADVTSDEHLSWLLDRLKISHVIDVGANLGQFALSLRSAGYRGRISSFEPVKANYELLRDAAASDPAWDVHHLALGAEPGELDINVTGSTAFSSFHKPAQYSSERFGKAAVGVAYTEKVLVERLDRLSDRLGISQRSRLFLKMDTQGFDVEVFRGAEGLLDRIYGLQSEVSVMPIYEHMPDYISALTAYREKGFEPTGFFPVTRDPERLVVIEYDCFMRNLHLD